jgi:4a-hydroxytetrahydrobiopterin dehydratase
MPKLTPSELNAALCDLEGWTAFGNALHKTFALRGFRAQVAFVNRIAEQALANGHHPDIEIHDGRVIVSITTRSEGGVTEKDVSLARAIDRVLEPVGVR